MATVSLNGASIIDWDAFHAECQRQFGFPESYGRNMDAWVDCLSYLRDEDGMSKFRLKPDEILEVQVKDAALLQEKMPEIMEELAFCIDAINDRYADYGEKPALKLTLL
jgi:hypothetical protein